MPAYVIAMVDVKDPVRYEDYRRMVLPTITAFGGRFIARGGRTEALEGELPAGRMVIVEFPSLDTREGVVGLPRVRRGPSAFARRPPTARSS